MYCIQLQCSFLIRTCTFYKTEILCSPSTVAVEGNESESTTGLLLSDYGSPMCRDPGHKSGVKRALALMRMGHLHLVLLVLVHRHSGGLRHPWLRLNRRLPLLWRNEGLAVGPRLGGLRLTSTAPHESSKFTNSSFRERSSTLRALSLKADAHRKYVARY